MLLLLLLLFLGLSRDLPPVIAQQGASECATPLRSYRLFAFPPGRSKPTPCRCFVRFCRCRVSLLSRLSSLDPESLSIALYPEMQGYATPDIRLANSLSLSR